MTRATTAVYTILCLVGGAVAVVLAWLPLRSSLSLFVIEDMFYYLQGARQLNAGNVASLDGVHATNGFHPLWMLVARWLEGSFGHDPELVVRLALTLCALMFALTGLLLFCCLKRTPAAALALPITALFLCNYRVMAIPLGGLESALSGLSVALLTLFLLRGGGGGHPAPWRSAVLGILLGAVSLARLDGLLLAAIVLGWWALASFRNQPGTATVRRRLTRALAGTALAGSVTVGVLLPWFVFSWQTSGTLLPNSRLALQAWLGHSWNDGLGTIGNLLAMTRASSSAAVQALNDVGNAVGIWPIATPERGPWKYLGGCLTALFLAWIGALALRNLKPCMRLLAWAALYVAAHVAYYVGTGLVTMRYIYPAFVPALLLAAQAAAGASRPSAGRGARLGAVLPALLLCGATAAGIGAFVQGQGTSRYHAMHLPLYQQVAPWLRQHVPPGARVGSFNAGILSYFSGCQVVNLDGVMNDSAIPALQHKRLCAYLEAEHVQYLADLQSEITWFLDGFGGDADWASGWEKVLGVPATFDAGREHAELVVLRRR